MIDHGPQMWCRPESGGPEEDEPAVPFDSTLVPGLMQILNPLDPRRYSLRRFRRSQNIPPPVHSTARGTVALDSTGTARGVLRRILCGFTVRSDVCLP
jgi:hypothetical protein